MDILMSLDYDFLRWVYTLSLRANHRKDQTQKVLWSFAHRNCPRVISRESAFSSEVRHTAAFRPGKGYLMEKVYIVDYVT